MKVDTVFDFKKEDKELYLPKTHPVIIDVPSINFVSVTGQGDPNDKTGDYHKAVELLYSIQYTIKMSKKNKTGSVPCGYFDYVVPPLEGFWWFALGEKTPPLTNSGSMDKSYKSAFNWISVIRLPEFVNENVFAEACLSVQKKKGIDTKSAKFITIKEGLCVQCMHLGSFDSEVHTLKLIDAFITENNLHQDINDKRHHHEIYLSDPRKTEDAKLKTVLRIPVKRL